MDFETTFSIVVLIVSVVVHEVSHGLAALYLGDETAKNEGRLTLNPLKHIDPFGSVILPVLLAITNAGFMLGWAKPVPFNPYNLRDQRWGPAIVAGAGPLSNIIIALFFGLLLRFGFLFLNSISPSLPSILASIVVINLVLAVFNMMPVPPLDGSKILFAFLPQSLRNYLYQFEKYGLFLIIIFILFVWQLVSPLILFLFKLIVGA